MTYGIIVNGQLIIHPAYRDGDKPIEYSTEPEHRDGFRTIYEWQEDSESIVQVWSEVEDHSEYEPIIPEPEEILDILTGESND